MWMNILDRFPNTVMMGGIRWFTCAEDGEMWCLHHPVACTCDFSAHATDL